ncbi:TetR/AcrR family transcriptional regulator [Paeniglutamicibacter cryotolerans]|uniref:AcrR family transcriptional regulator n=1 Tax=Paeniglutamicibacter cryotolerans TaxID=670079 RepID=A0A839QM42_9MICC|nr:TetR/AcrR family transcriptional regulator [Paeniglutamicibacter cryotolerans]MBB2996830.1 AcrR family transcriptional regulator [Paeniglutamicibacter cryotolerans]
MIQRRLAPALRRAQIAEAAREAILRDGLRTTGLREIARQAQTSVGTVTYHFGSIREIILEAAVIEAERFYAPVITAVDAEADVGRALLLLIDPLFDGTEDTLRHWRFWSDYWSEWARDPDTRQEDYGRLRLWSSCCERTIRRGIATGTFKADVDPLAVAVKTAAFMDGIYTQISLGAPALDHTVARGWMRGFLQAELGAAFERS